jgi:tetratricopeptide (TPR) repeat protein
LTLFERAVAVTEDNWVALNNVAWLRAACPDAEVRNGERAVALAERACRVVRNGERAVALAERACRVTRYRDGEYVDTLATAYAEAGRFDDAIASSKRAIRLALAAGRTQAADAFRERLAHFEKRRPYRSSRACP